MKIIVFDTETSGLPCFNKLTTIVQFSYVMYDTELCAVIKEVDHIISQPPGFIIPENSINIHKVTNEMCLMRGRPLIPILDEFLKDVSECYHVVGHNVQFDIRMIKMSYENQLYNIAYSGNTGELFNETRMLRKLRFINNILIPKAYCTMYRGTKISALPKKIKAGLSGASEGKATQIVSKSTSIKKETYKYPKLSELHNALFGYCPDGLHNSLVDVHACLRCYLAITRI